MTEDEYAAVTEGRAGITVTTEGATKILREQLEASVYLRKPEQRLDRAMMALGALLAFVPDEQKDALLDLVRNGLPAEVAS